MTRFKVVIHNAVTGRYEEHYIWAQDAEGAAFLAMQIPGCDKIHDVKKA